MHTKKIEQLVQQFESLQPSEHKEVIGGYLSSKFPIPLLPFEVENFICFGNLICTEPKKEDKPQKTDDANMANI